MTHHRDMSSQATRSRPRARGFSLLELIVAVSILAIVGVMAVPRFLVVESQREEKAIVAVEDLLRMFAFRNSAGLQQVSLHYSREEGAITLWIMDLNPADPEGPRIWQQDRLSAPAELPDDFIVERAVADATPLADDEWMIASNPDGSRPRIELSLAGRERRADLVLETYTNAPVRSNDPRARVLSPVNLDEEGSAFDKW